MLEPRSFDICKNTVVLIIAMLDHLELDIKVLDIGMETTESNDCRGMLRDDGDTNSMLAMIQERARFSYKDR